MLMLVLAFFQKDLSERIKAGESFWTLGECEMIPIGFGLLLKLL